MKTLTATTALALALAAPALAQTAEGQQQQEVPAEQQAPQADTGQQQVAPAEGEPQEQPAEAEAPEAEAPAPEAPEVEGATGLETGAIGETFFIRAPQEYHLLASDLAGQQVFIDATAAGAQAPVVADPEAAGTVAEDIREGVRPAGVVADVLLDRAGQMAALVVELDGEMRGGARRVAVAGGLVRMAAARDDPGQTLIMLQLDPVDLENAPTFAHGDEAEQQ